MRVSKLLERPDRLIGVILIGNNLVNIIFTLVASVITVKLFGQSKLAEFFLPFVLTLVILIFAEVTPKSIAAVFPEKVAYPASFVLRPLLIMLYPLVWFINLISNALSRLFGMDPSKAKLTDHLHPDELRNVVDEAGDLIPDQHQDMLINVLDLEKSTVEDILVPRNDIVGINLEDDLKTIVETISHSEYTMLPVFEGDINQVIGVLHLRHIIQCLKPNSEELTTDILRERLSPAYFVPESTPLSRQLLNFQKEKARMALVVDEYGDIQGLVTLVDLLEEIVGDFTTDAAEDEQDPIKLAGNGWFSIDASESIRDINKELGWRLPTSGPKTLNGLITEFLESIPDAIVSFEIGNYRFQVESFSETRIECALVTEKPSETAE